MAQKGAKQQTNTRGQLAEFEESLTNIQASIEHFFDLGELDLIDQSIVQSLRETRKSLTGLFFGKDVNYDYWCAYKHLLLARIQLKELIQTQIDKKIDISKLHVNLKELERILHNTRLRFLNISPSELEDPDCVRCLEDYLLQENNNDKKI